MVDMVDDHIAVGQHGVDVAAAALVVGAEVALVIAPTGQRLSQLSSGWTRMRLSFAVW